MTPTEREEFEMVAKAAGIEFDYISQGHAFNEYDEPVWSPRADDGDAFRLLIGIWKRLTLAQIASIHMALHSGDETATREAIWQCALECARRGK